MRTIVRIIPSALEKTFWNLVRIRNPICCAFASQPAMFYAGGQNIPTIRSIVLHCFGRFLAAI
jgi:hypothetical protein